jgi:hypothetical protein
MDVGGGSRRWGSVSVVLVVCRSRLMCAIIYPRLFVFSLYFMSGLRNIYAVGTACLPLEYILQLLLHLECRLVLANVVNLYEQLVYRDVTPSRLVIMLLRYV